MGLLSRGEYFCCSFEGAALFPGAVKDVKDVRAATSAAIVDEVVSCGKAVEARYDARHTLTCARMFA
jgi:hypothetical protein